MNSISEYQRLNILTKWKIQISKKPVAFFPPKLTNWHSIFMAINSCLPMWIIQILAVFFFQKPFLIQVSVIVAVVIWIAFLSSNMINEWGIFCYNNESKMATKPDHIDLTTFTFSKECTFAKCGRRKGYHDDHTPECRARPTKP